MLMINYVFLENIRAGEEEKVVIQFPLAVNPT